MKNKTANHTNSDVQRKEMYRLISKINELEKELAQTKQALEQAQSKIEKERDLPAILFAEFRRQYPHVSERALTVLANAEATYQARFDDIIDFTGLAASYGKAIELHLIDIMDLKSSPSNHMTLGSVVHHLYLISNRQYDKCYKYCQYYPLLQRVHNIRNNAVHYGSATSKDIQKLRSLLLEEPLQGGLFGSIR